MNHLAHVFTYAWDIVPPAFPHWSVTKPASPVASSTLESVIRTRPRHMSCHHLNSLPWLVVGRHHPSRAGGEAWIPGCCCVCGMHTCMLVRSICSGQCFVVHGPKTSNVVSSSQVLHKVLRRQNAYHRCPLRQQCSPAERSLLSDDLTAPSSPQAQARRTTNTPPSAYPARRSSCSP